MNLLVGFVCWLLLRSDYSWSAASRLFLVLVMTYSTFWGAGYLVLSAVTNTGDWAFVLRDLDLRPMWLWRIAMGALGIVLCFYALQTSAGYLPTGTPLIFIFIVGSIVACGAALSYNGPILPALREAMQEGVGAGIGLLLIASRRARQVDSRGLVVSLPRSNVWLITSAAVLVLFLSTFGRGLTFHN